MSKLVQQMTPRERSAVRAHAPRVDTTGGRHAKKHGFNRKADARLEARRSDYEKMISQREIGDGHREANGYHRPGSHKKVGG